MYVQLKNWAKRIVPNQWLRKHEGFLRGLIALQYKGKTYQCNVCGYALRAFIELEDKGKLCPNCGSLARTRYLWQFLLDAIGLKDKVVLHFSPPKKISQRLKRSGVKEYVTTDFENEFTADKQLNIEEIDERDAVYDLIICFHVLEHIENDRKAMAELYRILKPGGRCLVQTPFKEGAIYEDADISTPEARLKHFGQEDHVRVYSVNGLEQRLQSVGFKVTRHTNTAAATNFHGFPKQLTLLIAEK